MQGQAQQLHQTCMGEDSSLVQILDKNVSLSEMEATLTTCIFEGATQISNLRIRAHRPSVYIGAL